MNVTTLHSNNKSRAGRKCGACGKHRYRDHDEAVASLHRAANARQRAALDGAVTDRREVRAYECDSCRGWHLTSAATWTKPVSVAGFGWQVAA